VQAKPAGEAPVEAGLHRARRLQGRHRHPLGADVGDRRVEDAIDALGPPVVRLDPAPDDAQEHGLFVGLELLGPPAGVDHRTVAVVRPVAPEELVDHLDVRPHRGIVRPPRFVLGGIATASR
jgi:hypothetical protein